jgi:hypothetical protein
MTQPSLRVKAGACWEPLFAKPWNLLLWTHNLIVRPNPFGFPEDMVKKSVQSKDLLVRVYFGRSYREIGMGMPHGVYRAWLGVFCYRRPNKTVQSL